MDDARARLTELMDQRRRELRLKWIGVAQRAGMSVQNLLRIRNGEIGVITDDAAEQIERGLQWAPGSVEVTLAGGAPTVIEQSARTSGASPATGYESSDAPAGRRKPTFTQAMDHCNAAYALGGDDYGWQAMLMMLRLAHPEWVEPAQPHDTDRSA